MLDKVTKVEPLQHDRDITYAYASSRLAKHWTNHNMAWSDFLTKLSQTVRTKESLIEYNKMSKSEQSDIKDVGGFVGGYLKEGRRQAGQVMNRSMLTLDLDYAAQDMTDIMSMFYDFAYAIYSTHKHRTPSPNSMMDLWAQVYLIDSGERLEKSFTRFRERYFKPTHQVSEHVFNWELREDAEELIYERIDDVCISMKASDYLSMPERIDTVQEVTLSNKERKLYDELERDYILESEDDGDIVAQSGASLSQKLLQLSNGAVYTDEQEVRQVHDRKLDKLEEIIEDSQGQPILLFYNFKHDKERILERFKQAVVLGSDNYKEEWDKGDIEILLAHPASAGHGLNLQQGGHIIVWFGLTWSLELYQQANARLYRQGQDNTTIIHHIMTDNTIEQRVYKALQNKELTQDELMNAVKARVAEYQ